MSGGRLRDALTGVVALAGLTLVEAKRQRLAWLLVIGVVALLILVPQLDAIDDAGRLKLSVAAVTGTIGFMTTLLGLLIAGVTIRRDIDARTGYLLFAKPLPRFAYLFGRWLGVQLVLVVFTLVLVLAGCLSIGWQLGGLPTPESTSVPDSWQRLHRGAVEDVPETRSRIILSGSPRRGEGAGVRVRFEDVPAFDQAELLLRAKVGGRSHASGIDRNRVSVSFSDADGKAKRLAIAKDSPYGHVADDPFIISLKDRAAPSGDLSQDFIRVPIPATAVRADGSLSLQIDRLEGDTYVTFDRAASIQLARPAGYFMTSLSSAGLVLAVQGGLLAAVAILLASVGRLPLVLLGGLTFFFGGHTFEFLSDGVRVAREAKVLLQRIVDLYGVVQPDFTAFPVAADLAAGKLVPMVTVGDACMYYGAYTAVALFITWLLLRKAEW